MQQKRDVLAAEGAEDYSEVPKQVAGRTELLLLKLR